MALTIGDLLVNVVVGNDAGLRNQIVGATTQAGTAGGTAASKSFADRFKAGLTTQNIGRGFMQGLGLGAGLGAVTAVAAAVNVVTDAVSGSIDAARGWESAMAGVSKTLDTTGLSSNEAADALAQIGDGLRDMAQEIPVPVEQLAALAEAGGALGIARDDLLEFTRTAALLGTTTNLAAQDAATALGKIGAVLPFTRDEYSRFAATLVDLGNKGASTEAEIVAMAQNMAGAASLIGLSKAQLLGWASALSNVGEEAEAGGSSFQRFALSINAIVGGSTELERAARTAGIGVDQLVESIMSGADGQKAMAEATGVTVKRLKELVGTRQDLDTLAQLAGTTASAFGELWSQDASKALQQVVNGLGQMDSQTRQATLAALDFKDVRITRALLSLASNLDNVNGSLEVGPAAWEKNTAAIVEAEKRYATTDSKIALIQARLHDAAIDFGTALIDTAGTAIDVLDRLGVAIGDVAARLSGGETSATLRAQRQALVELAAQYGVSMDALDAFNASQQAIADDAAAVNQFIADMGVSFRALPDGDAKNSLIAGLVQDLKDFAREGGLPLQDVLSHAKANLANFDVQAQGTGLLLGFLANQFHLVTDRAGEVVPGVDEARAALMEYLREVVAASATAQAQGQRFLAAGFSSGQALGTGLVKGLEQTVPEFIAAFDELSAANPAGGAKWGKFITDNMAFVEERFDELPRTIQRAFQAAGLHIDDGKSILADALAGVGSTVKAATDAVLQDIEDRQAWFDAGIGFAFDLAGGVRKGVKDSEPELRGAVSELQKMLRFDWDSEATVAMGEAFIRAVTRGFNSGVPELEERAQEASLGALVAMERSAKTGPKAADRIGLLLSKLYAKGLTRGEVEARLAAEGVNLTTLEAIARKAGWRSGGEGQGSSWYKGVVDGATPSGDEIKKANAKALRQLSAKAGWNGGGSNLGEAWVDGLVAALNTANGDDGRISLALSRISRKFVGSSPPPEGPLRHIDVGGANVGEAWRESFLASIGISDTDITKAIGLGSLSADPLEALRLTSMSTVASSVSVTGADGLRDVSLSGHATVDMRHTITPEGAVALRNAGYNEGDVARLLREAGDQGGLRFTDPVRD